MEKNRAILQEVGGSWHVAFKVTQAAFDELMERCHGGRGCRCAR